MEPRSAALSALRLVKDARVVEPLIDVLKYEVISFYFRRDAALALGELGDERAIEALNEALNDIDFEVRSAAAKALSSLTKTLKDKDIAVQE